MAATVYALVRFFKTESHREDFLRGDLYMQRLKYFKQYEESDKCNIGDRHEGLSGWLQPDDIVKLTIENNETGEIIHLDGLAGPLRFGYNHHAEYHVYCMSAMYAYDDSDVDNLDALRSEVMLDVSKGDLGDYCSVVFGMNQFFSRLNETLNGLEGVRVGHGIVEYYDPDSFSGTFNGDEAVFRKSNYFSHQKEFRIFAWDGTEGENPRRLNIGDLSDIVFNCHKTELNTLVSLDYSAPSEKP
ncbi:hypothetical protein KVG88_19235 [Pseudomonas sp. SWRI74]|uniref:Uncharacterized protein n=1 Tax=Pseudomonas azerbaijanoccidentalis TaxID=2842347 RepID=A0ABS6QTF0_9PSED|nr:hypothetical protein [Pseudomonas azerbaijanoccidentalis]MBV4522198.1 hypothetical protein [Pseudomonas azerbaijanoccidentalis]